LSAAALSPGRGKRAATPGDSAYYARADARQCTYTNAGGGGTLLYATRLCARAARLAQALQRAKPAYHRSRALDAVQAKGLLSCYHYNRRFTFIATSPYIVPPGHYQYRMYAAAPLAPPPYSALTACKQTAHKPPYNALHLYALYLRTTPFRHLQNTSPCCLSTAVCLTAFCAFPQPRMATFAPSPYRLPASGLANLFAHGCAMLATRATSAPLCHRAANMQRALQRG